MTRIKIHSPVRCGVVVVALSSLVLAGCATSSNPAAEATKGKTITVWTTDTLPDRVVATKAIIAKFTAATGIHVKLVGVAGATAPRAAFTQQTFEHVALANNCQMVDRTGKITLDSPECVNALRFYGDLIKN